MSIFPLLVVVAFFGPVNVNWQSKLSSLSVARPLARRQRRVAWRCLGCPPATQLPPLARERRRHATHEQLRGIIGALLSTQKNMLCTRLDAEIGAALAEEFEALRYDEVARVVYAHGDNEVRGQGTIGVVVAGTSDLPVAREAELCATVMGNEVRTWTDVGVAGLHRLLGVLDEIREARVVITVAGMEAALPSVLAGLLARPVVSVPTSVGYGASFDGLAALLSSLTACAPGVVTVNIDNGFGAAYAASLMNRP